MGLLRFALYPAKRGTVQGFACNDMSLAIKLSLALGNNGEKICNRITCIKRGFMLEKNHASAIVYYLPITILSPSHGLFIWV
jgi:hypothetical protein